MRSSARLLNASGTRSKLMQERATQLVHEATEKRRNGWDCLKRLQSSGYQDVRMLSSRGGWYAFATDRGIVAITRHPGGRWEIRPFTPPTKETT